MTYVLEKNKIIISGKDDFNPQHILECGQIFAYQKESDAFTVFSTDKSAKIVETEFGYEIITSDPKYFENFFDLKTDYAKIKAKLLQYEIMKKPIEFGHGIRILKNDIFEIVVSFIISANNNIKRIQKIITSLKEKLTGGVVFPSHEQLLSLSTSELKGLGLGYRAEQLYKTLRMIDVQTLESWQSLQTDQLRKKLLSLSGVGPKVADCILLFGYGKKDVFPVDVWIHKMYNMFYGPLENREKIRQNLVETFENLSGYAQQYLFYFQRSFVKN